MTDTWAFLALRSPPVFSIAPEHDFLTCIANTLFCPHATDAVADSLVLVPNRRSGRSLATALVDTAKLHGYPAIILPTILPLEYIATLDDRLPQASTTNTVLSGDERRGVLARLIRHWHARVYSDQPDLAPAQALAWANHAGELLDQADHAGGCDFSRLDQLVDDSDLAEHWQDGARFLRMVLAQAWPQWLTDTNSCTQASNRRQTATRLVNHWKNHPPQAPVWIAGSTGAVPIDRTLMRAVINLPRGAVILPGVDVDASTSDWEHISISPSHPQYTTKRTLDHLELAPSDVRNWPNTGVETPQARARRRLIYQALAPAAATCDWTDRLSSVASADGYDNSAQFIGQACHGLHLIDADNDSEQAMIAALALRQAVQTPDRTAALVTPDAELGRRVSCLLHRFGIDIAHSRGARFAESDHGRLMTAAIDAAQDPADPVCLLALLKQPLARFGRSGDVLRSHTAQLEMAREDKHFLLRGPRRHANLSDLAERLTACNALDARNLILDVTAALGRLADILASHPVQPEHAIDALGECLTAIAAGPDTHSDNSILSEALTALTRIARGYGEIPARHLPDLISAGVENLPVSHAAEHPRLAIWGPLEARLHRRDLLVLAGLNEKTWPRAAPIDALLPSRLRAGLGLPDTEEILGLSAHDFSQLACNPEVLLLRPVTSGQTRTVASRWIWRLRKLCQAGLAGNTPTDVLGSASAQTLRHWARQCSLPYQQPTPTPRPQPRPPLHARPRKISASSVRFLLTDPYVIYARDILKLRPLPAAASPFDARLRGDAVHRALETFAERGLPVVEAVRTDLLALGMTQSQWAIEAPLWERAASEFLVWNTNRRTQVKQTHSEISGRIPLGSVTLSARADRIDELADGSLAILDYKTGKPPSRTDVESHHQPQLPVEALIALHGGFEETGARDVRALIYYQFSTSRCDTKNGEALKLDPAQAAHAISNHLTTCLNQFANADHPYAPRQSDGPHPSDYDRLSRRAEWTNS